ncbi:unnamed protein product [Toxocara canis]|uniref:Uncharacterized protein n=1 Tax=Toxocara canis TaxID=6265 RepID=A0A183V1Q8_TOXCA|nr:unnamed protein product [Toxocara canis]
MLSNNGPQFPARQKLRSTAPAGRKVFGERLLKISGAMAGALCGLRLSLCTYNCRSLSGADRLNYLMEERKKICCDFLGISETRRASSLTAQYKDEAHYILEKVKASEEEEESASS